MTVLSSFSKSTQHSIRDENMTLEVKVTIFTSIFYIHFYIFTHLLSEFLRVIGNIPKFSLRISDFLAVCCSISK